MQFQWPPISLLCSTVLHSVLVCASVFVRPVMGINSDLRHGRHDCWLLYAMAVQISETKEGTMTESIYVYDLSGVSRNIIWFQDNREKVWLYSYQEVHQASR